MSGYDANTKFLWNCDGADGDTNDQTATTGQTVTTVGNAQIDTADKKMGDRKLSF